MATPTTLPSTFTAGQVLTAAQMNNLRGAFRVLQVVSTTKTDTFTTSTAGSWVDITGLTATITPSSTSSKILVVATINSTVFRPGVVARAFQFVRGSTAIGVGDAAGSRLQAGWQSGSSQDEYSMQTSASILDSPATTSATTYGVQVRQGGAVAFYLNRSTNDANSIDGARTASAITVMEISA